jgi:Rieske Fe-S protein
MSFNRIPDRSGAAVADRDRRTFLRVVGAGACAFAAGGCAADTSGSHSSSGDGGAGTTGPVTSSSSSSSSASGTGGSCPGGPVNVGPVSAYTQPGLYLEFGTSVIVGLDAGGFYALSSICTHRGCDMNFDGTIVNGEVECLCHGSVFAADGSVARGPAFSPLPAFAMTVECGTLYVDTSQIVSNTQRLQV